MESYTVTANLNGLNGGSTITRLGVGLTWTDNYGLNDSNSDHSAVTDQCIALSASQFGRAHGYGDNWNTLRIALAHNVKTRARIYPGAVFGLVCARNHQHARRRNYAQFLWIKIRHKLDPVAASDIYNKSTLGYLAELEAPKPCRSHSECLL